MSTSNSIASKHYVIFAFADAPGKRLVVELKPIVRTDVGESAPPILLHPEPSTARCAAGLEAEATA